MIVAMRYDELKIPKMEIGDSNKYKSIVCTIGAIKYLFSSPGSIVSDLLVLSFFK